MIGANRFTVGCLTVVLLGACGLLRAQSQAASDTQACQGSTVDTQGAEFAKKSRAFLVDVQAAVAQGDKAKIAAMISYPLLVIRDDRRTRIKTSSEFLSKYDTIFDAHVRQAVAQQTAKCLFGNYQGAMIGAGEVWFSEQSGGAMKIVTVNPTAAS